MHLRKVLLKIKKNVKAFTLLNTSGIYYVSSNNAAFSSPVLLQSSEEWMERRAAARLDDTGTPSETESEDEPILYRDTLPDQGVITPPSGFASPGADPNPQNLVRSHSWYFIGFLLETESERTTCIMKIDTVLFPGRALHTKM